MLERDACDRSNWCQPGFAVLTQPGILVKLVQLITEFSTAGTFARFKTGIFVIGKIKPTITIRAEMWLIFPEIEPIECAFIFLAPNLNGKEILIT